MLDLTVRKGSKRVALQKIKDTHAEQVGDDTDVTSVVETVS